MTPRSLQLDLPSGASVFGEVSEVAHARGCVLLLHDRGSDLDALRPFASPLQSLELTTVLVDLPGHGLSGGTWGDDGASAVRQALDECRRLHPHVGAVAAGSTCALLYGLHPAPVRVVALVAPALTDVDLSGSDAWRVVPTISMGDPCDEATDESMERLARWIRAWSLRLNVHYLDPPEGASNRWTPHMTHSAAAFVAEQLAYAERAEDSSTARTPAPSTSASTPRS